MKGFETAGKALIRPPFAPGSAVVFAVASEIKLVYGIKFAFKRRINGLYTVQRATDGRCHRADSVRITAQS